MADTRVLILGGSGMLGHKLVQVLPERFDTAATVRAMSPEIQGIRAGIGTGAGIRIGTGTSIDIGSRSRLITGVCGEDFDSVTAAVSAHKPNVIINCIGLVKQLPEASDPIKSIGINSLFPHRLANLCRAVSARLIHISTDCVFSGNKGDYTEADRPDADDLYGRSKALGEVTGEGCLTIRTSIIGHQIKGDHGLVEWYLRQRGKSVPGYRKALFSGLPTVCLAEIIGKILTDYPHLSGLWHVSSDPISKFDLLNLIGKQYSLHAQVVPDDSVAHDRCLNSKRFCSETGIKIPSWPDMIERMHTDGAMYDQPKERDLIKR